MAVKIGDKIPEGTLVEMTKDGPNPVTTGDLFGGKTVALFAVPGADYSTESWAHFLHRKIQTDR